MKVDELPTPEQEPGMSDDRYILKLLGHIGVLRVWLLHFEQMAALNKAGLDLARAVMMLED